MKWGWENVDDNHYNLDVAQTKPVYGKGAVVNKVLVVCPVTLISNWRQEFRKWLGANKLNVLTLNNNVKRETGYTQFWKVECVSSVSGEL